MMKRLENILILIAGLFLPTLVLAQESSPMGDGMMDGQMMTGMGGMGIFMAIICILLIALLITFLVLAILALIKYLRK